jgi:predicted transcriptional regulator
MDILKAIEKQSGFLRLIVFLSKEGEKPLTSILRETDIPVHQLYSSIEKAKEMKLVNTRIDNTSYPARSMVSLTDKGKKFSEKINEMAELISSD